MKRQWKGFITGFITACLVLSLGAPALAASVKQLKASYNNIKITLDGKEFTPKDAGGNVVEPFIVDGTTYLPVRAVANALGLGVGWNEAANTVMLTSDGSTPVAPAAPAAPAPTQPVTPSPTTTQQGDGYRITYQNCVLKESSVGGTSCYAIVEVENTGTSNLYLDDATFDFEDRSGKLITTYSTMISADPDIIAPGEKGYFYCNGGTLGNNITVNSDYIFKPNIRVEKAKNSIIRYDISDTTMTEGKFGPVQITGRLTNNTQEEGGLIWVACVLYRTDGTPIGAFGTNLTGVKVGETRSFSADAIYLMGLGINFSDIASYKVYACKTQYQF